MQRTSVLILLILLGSTTLKGQIANSDTLVSPNTIKLDLQYAKKYWTDTKEVVTAPLRWEKNQWFTAGAVVGSTALLLLVDEDINREMTNARTSGLDRIAQNILEPWGSETPWKNYSFYTIGAFGAYGLISKDERSWNTALLAFEAYALTYVYVRGIKWIVGRERPSDLNNTGAWNWNGPGGGKSFPSNHTASVFAMAAVFAEQYKETKWVPWVSYSFASLVGLSRVYDNEHWASDVFMGACLGTAVGQLIARNHHSKKMTFIPIVSPDYTGVSLHFALN